MTAPSLSDFREWLVTSEANLLTMQSQAERDGDSAKATFFRGERNMLFLILQRVAKMTAPPATWHPVTDIPPASWHLVAVGGEVHEALYFANADNIANLLISAVADHPLINGRWRIANDTTHRMMMRKGARVTAWAEMPLPYTEAAS